MAAVLLLLAGSAFAASYSTGTIYSPELKAAYSHTCGDFVYDPEIFQMSNGNLRVLAQGGNINTDRDSLMGFTRTASTGAWSVPTASAPNLAPALEGQYARCGYTPSSTNGPIGSPSVVKVGSKYYMAYVGGNADQITGKVYWAVSTDGSTWSLYSVSPPGGQLLTPIIYPTLHEECNTLNLASGVGQVHLAYQDGYFYFYLRYGHWSNQFLSVESLAFRVQYNSANTWGLGSTREIWQGTTYGWIANSGALLWDYDCQPDPNGNIPAACPPPSPDTTLVRGRGASNFTFYPGDLKLEAGLANTTYPNGKWVHFYQNGAAGSALTWESNGNLAQPQSWAAGGTINIQTLKNLYGSTVEVYYPGVYFGSLCSGCPSRYIFIPIDGASCAADFQGTMIVPAELVFTP